MLNLFFCIAGYIGLWRNLLDKIKYYYRTNNLLLILGLISYIIFSLIIGKDDIFNINPIKDFLWVLFFFYPFIAAIIILVDNFTQIKHKRNK